MNYLNNKYYVIKNKNVILYFLLKSDEIISMEKFMTIYKLTPEMVSKDTNKIIDFYNSVIKLENNNNCNLNHLILINFDDKQSIKLINEIENNKNFIKWVTTEDKKWVEIIIKYFSSDNFYNYAKTVNTFIPNE